jgi:uncharacterized phage protein (predicted DNA packaging)
MTEPSVEYIEAVRQALRISHIYLDEEIRDLIQAARADLRLIGILESKTDDESDPLIRRAVIVYVKAEFGLDNGDSVKYRESYEMLKLHLALSDAYTVAEEAGV